MWQNSKTQIAMKLKNSYWLKTQNSKCDKINKKKQKNKNKLWQNKNSNCDKTQKLKLWPKSNCDKTQAVTKLKLLQNSNCDKSQVVTLVTVLIKQKNFPGKTF